jgi:hypothetical protein
MDGLSGNQFSKCAHDYPGCWRQPLFATTLNTALLGKRPRVASFADLNFEQFAGEYCLQQRAGSSICDRHARLNHIGGRFSIHAHSQP